MASSKIRILLDMIKFEHTVFALPFAYLGMVLGARGWPDFATWAWITLAMVGARTYAMTLNRLLDRDIDSRNPRTSGWALPAGRVRIREAVALALLALGAFFVAVFMLPELCQKLWPIVLVPMTFYSLAKRFTWACHLLLGTCLGLAPLGAWVATTGTLPPAAVLALGLAVTFWTAGFDIIYSCQDYSFDLKELLHSIPVRFGIPRALRCAKLLHALTVLLLLVMGMGFSLGPAYYAGLALIALFLLYENRVVRPDDLSRLNLSFFTLNGLVSLLALISTLVSLAG